MYWRLKYDFVFDSGSVDAAKDYIFVELNGKYGLVDETGKEIVECKYDSISRRFSEGLADVCLNGKWGFIDKTGKEIIECKYDKTTRFNEGLALVELNGKCGLINKNGKEVVECKYDNLWHSKSFYAVKLNDKWGFLDKTGKQWWNLNMTMLKSVAKALLQ